MLIFRHFNLASKRICQWYKYFLRIAVLSNFPALTAEILDLLADNFTSMAYVLIPRTFELFFPQCVIAAGEKV